MLFFLVYPLKSSNLFNFREGHQNGRGCPWGHLFNRGGGGATVNITPLHWFNFWRKELI